MRLSAAVACCWVRVGLWFFFGGSFGEVVGRLSTPEQAVLTNNEAHGDADCRPFARRDYGTGLALF